MFVIISIFKTLSLNNSLFSTWYCLLFYHQLPSKQYHHLCISWFGHYFAHFWEYINNHKLTYLRPFIWPHWNIEMTPLISFDFILLLYGIRLTFCNEYFYMFFWYIYIQFSYIHGSVKDFFCNQKGDLFYNKLYKTTFAFFFIKPINAVLGILPWFTCRTWIIFLHILFIFWLNFTRLLLVEFNS